MKKITAVVICLFMLCTFFSAYADENVTVYIDGKLINFDVQPIVIDGRTLVPMRKLFEELGATVEWDNDRNTAFAYSKGIYVKMPVGKDYYMIDEIIFSADVPAQEINGRTLVPLRVISEAFGMDVDYDDSTKTVNMTSANKIGRYDKGNKYYYGHLENGLPGDFGEVYDTATDTLLEAGSFDGDLNRLFGVAYLKGSFNGRRYTGTINFIGNNAVYDGGMINGVFCGYGKLKWADGSVYEGKWEDGLLNGYGKCTWEDGDVFEGEYKDGLPNGYGKYTWATGEVYEGEWKDDKLNGYGKYTWADGTIYEGEYKDDKRNGHGKYTWEDGSVYEGEWKDGERNGYGIQIYTDGSIQDGYWENDKFISPVGE